MKKKRLRPRPATDRAALAGESGPGERLQKVLAASGLGSRRECEELIREGRVEVDRKVVTELGTRVDPLAQEIRVDGESLRKAKRVYFAVNKPVGVVTTNFDPSGRSRVIDLVPTDERVFAVGRLDRSSEGLILVTNDGEFANRLTHPRYGVEKTYLVRVAGAPDQRQLARLKKGIHLAEGFARAQSIAVKKSHGQSTDLVIVLSEGRNREIRRILARVGHKVLSLKRVSVGRVKLGDLPVGGWRKLSAEEVQGLLSAAKEKRREEKKRVRGAGTQPKVHGPRSKVESGSASAVRDDQNDQYVQRQALLAEPLSLDDLLGDDLDEGPLTAADLPGADLDSLAIAGGEVTRGGVIDYEDDAVPLQPRPNQEGAAGRPAPARRGGESQRAKRQPDKRTQTPGRPKQSQVAGDGRQRAKRPDQRGGRFQTRHKFEGRTGEEFGKKRGGKRTFGQAEEGRGSVGQKTGSHSFPQKRKKSSVKAQGADNQRRGQRRGGGKPKTQAGGGGPKTRLAKQRGDKRKGRR